MDNKVSIYILRCQKNKYYVGKSVKIENKILNHLTNNGSEWTKIYPPQEVIEQYDDCDSFDEDKYTIKTMIKYCVNNVRDGSFCTVKLTKSDYDIINRMINTVKDKCYYCNKPGHFINNCKIKQKNELSNNKPNITNNNKIKQKLCLRCGRTTHNINDCYAVRHLNGYELDMWQCEYCDKMFNVKDNCTKHEKQCKLAYESIQCVRCERYGHKSVSCIAKTKYDASAISNNCYRCGKYGHWRINCYEKVDIYGNNLTKDDNICSLM